MPSRYKNRRKIKNEEEFYEEVFEDRGVNLVVQYSTPKLKRLTPAQRRRIQTIDHIWQYGDKYYKIAFKYYGNPEYWWVIAQFNYAPTEAHLVPGVVLKVPISLEDFLRYTS